MVALGLDRGAESGTLGGSPKVRANANTPERSLRRSTTVHLNVKRSLLAALTLIAVAGPARADVLHVNAAAAPGGDGLSWATALQTVDEALAVGEASAGALAEVWIAAGTYRPGFGGTNRSQTFELFSGAIVRGGFAGNETTIEQRIDGANPTILSGDIGVPNDSSDNCFHVVSMRLLFAPFVLDGVSIVKGRADGGSFPDNSGGGLLSEGSGSIVNCEFAQNEGTSGAGAFSRFGSGTFTECRFVANAATSEGGGLYIRDSGLVSNCSFAGNNASFGGGLWVCCGPVEVADSAFASNFGNFGGAVFNSSGALRMKRSTFEDNSASRGGAVHAGTNCVLASCFFAGNSGDRGGAVYANSTASIMNCVLSRNFALSSGGGVWATTSLTLASSTLHGNTALLFGGGLYLESGSVNVGNAILWSNQDSSGTTQGSQVTRVGGSLWINASCVQGWNGLISGSGNISTPPLFVNPGGIDGTPGTLDDDFRLSVASPCLDTGNAALLPADTADVDEDDDVLEPLPRDLALAARRIEHYFVPPNGPAGAPPPDMGALEFVPPPRVPGDTDGDMLVNFTDITNILASWGQLLVPADVDESGEVGFSDLTMVLANWM